MATATATKKRTTKRAPRKRPEPMAGAMLAAPGRVGVDMLREGWTQGQVCHWLLVASHLQAHVPLPEPEPVMPQQRSRWRR